VREAPGAIQRKSSTFCLSYLWETLSYVYRYEWDTPAVFSCGILSRRCAPPKAITLSVNLNPKRARPPAGVFSGWCGLPCGVAQTRPPTEAAFYRLKRAKYLVCNIYDATLKIIAVAKVKANIVIHDLQLHRLAGGSANDLSATGA
jgi:hypothetical protein